MKSTYYIFFMVLFALYSCGSSNNNSESVVNSSDEATDTLKSGIIYMQSTQPINGSDVERIIYFDDYGSRKRTETVARMMVGKQEVSTTHVLIEADGFTYNYDPEKKMGTKSKSQKGFNPTQLDFSSINKNTMQQFGIRNEGTEVVAGKTCKIYTLEYPAMDNFKGRYAVWNNIRLHETSSTDQFSYEYIAQRIEENPNIEPYMFVAPDSIVFNESSRVADSLRHSSISDSVNNQLQTVKQR